MLRLTHSSGDLIADRRFEFGRGLASRGDFSAAIDLFVQAIEAAPAFAPAWFALGEARRQLGDVAAAEAAFRKALKIDPLDRLGAALQLERLQPSSGARDAATMPPGTAMSPGYLRALFDQYAPGFDAALARLNYRGPERLREAVRRARPALPDHAFDDVLDLGCGTGLGGAVFRPLSRRLAGIDLSAAMIAQARSKKIYDWLETGDLIDRLLVAAARREAYDLIIAADVFVYISDLGPVAAAVAAVLRPGGLFAFTVETGGGEGVELGETLRYRHGAAHVHAALAAAGLQILELSAAVTRSEAGSDVAGLLALAARPSTQDEPSPIKPIHMR